MNSENFTFRELVMFIDRTPDQFLEQHIRSQTSDLNGIVFNRLVRLENFKTDMTHICNLLDITPSEFNEEFMPSYHYFYDDELKEIVGNKFKSDVDFFKYKFED